MQKTLRLRLCGLGLAGVLCFSGAAYGQTRAIDSQSSIITIRIFKAGLFSAFAHDHIVQARGLIGLAHTEGNPSVEFTLSARQLKVVDPDVSAQDRAEIQRTMEEKVLEINRFPEIRFQSTSVVARAPGRWEVRGNLALHGQTRVIAFMVQKNGQHYRGTTTLRQKDFGIEPVRIAGGTVRVKDEITIEFDAGLADRASPERTAAYEADAWVHPGIDTCLVCRGRSGASPAVLIYSREFRIIRG